MQHQLISNYLSVGINYFGAEICSVKNKKNLEFIWQADKTVWARHAPVLFPIVGKLNQNEFVYDNKTYVLPQHGFARDMNFELIEAHETCCRFRLTSTSETKIKFPFDFTFEIEYLLVDNKLTTGYHIKNTTANEIFFSVGAHPGFNCPLLPNESIEDYYLEFERVEYNLTELNNGLRKLTKKKLQLQNNKLRLSKNLFDNDALVFENHQINKINLCSTKSLHKISLECRNWPYFGIWAKPLTHSFICLEPWYGIADSENTNQQFKDKDGIICLGAHTEFSCSFSVSFS